MPTKQVFLLYNNESDKDLLMANNLATFLSIDPNIALKDILAGEDKEDLKRHILESDLVVPVVSIDFLNSKEAVNLIEEVSDTDVLIKPVLFRQCPWDQVPVLKNLASNIVPKEKPLNEYDEKSSDSILTIIFNSIKKSLFNGESGTKLGIDKFYLGLLIAAIIFAIATSFKAYDSFFLNNTGINDPLNGGKLLIEGRTIFYLFVLGNIITIGLPLMKLLAPKFLSSIFNKS